MEKEEGYMMGKNFDLFIEHREHIPEYLRRYINQAKLFIFDMFPTETFNLEHIDEINDLSFNFCLPFPVVAVEDKTSCVILWDVENNSVGIENRRGMMEISNTENYLEDEAYKITSQDIANGITEGTKKDDQEGLRKLADEMGSYPKIFRFGYGSLSWEKEIRKWKGETKIEICDYIFDSGLKIDFEEQSRTSIEAYRAMETDFMRGMITPYEELLKMSSRNYFILEKIPKPKKKKKKKRKFLKSHERPICTVVTPKKARKIMGIASPKSKEEGDKRQIKERRAYVRREHDRELRSPKFTKKQGEIINVKRTYVPAIWRGESTKDCENHFYKVILNLPKGVIESCGEFK